MDGLSPSKVEKAREAIDFLSSLSLPEPSRSDNPVSESLHQGQGMVMLRVLPVRPFQLPLAFSGRMVSFFVVCCRPLIAFILLPI